MEEIIKIRLADLLPSPCLRKDKLPILEEKVQRLMGSIHESGSSQNIVVRPSNQEGKFEIAFGRHRVEALRRLNMEVVQVTVRDLDDVDMILLHMDDEDPGWYDRYFPQVRAEEMGELDGSDL